MLICMVAVRLCCCNTLLLSYCAAVLLRCCNTLLLSYLAAVLLCCCPHFAAVCFVC